MGLIMAMRKAFNGKKIAPDKKTFRDEENSPFKPKILHHGKMVIERWLLLRRAHMASANFLFVPFDRTYSKKSCPNSRFL
jgi:hypothetical protein